MHEKDRMIDDDMREKCTKHYPWFSITQFDNTLTQLRKGGKEVFLPLKKQFPWLYLLASHSITATNNLINATACTNPQSSNSKLKTKSDCGFCYLRHTTWLHLTSLPDVSLRPFCCANEQNACIYIRPYTVTHDWWLLPLPLSTHLFASYIQLIYCDNNYDLWYELVMHTFSLHHPSPIPLSSAIACFCTIASLAS